MADYPNPNPNPNPDRDDEEGPAILRGPHQEIEALREANTLLRAHVVAVEAQRDRIAAELGRLRDACAQMQGKLDDYFGQVD